MAQPATLSAAEGVEESVFFCCGGMGDRRSSYRKVANAWHLKRR
jgi:hypothetical protein